jgi:hypothetical protein
MALNIHVSAIKSYKCEICCELESFHKEDGTMEAKMRATLWNIALNWTQFGVDERKMRSLSNPFSCMQIVIMRAHKGTQDHSQELLMPYYIPLSLVDSLSFDFLFRGGWNERTSISIFYEKEEKNERETKTRGNGGKYAKNITKHV